MSGKIPVKPIRFIFKKYYTGEICENVCTYVRDFLLSITNDLAINAVQEFKKYNNRRTEHGLPQLKRLNKYVIMRCLDKIIKQYANNNIGKGGIVNDILLCQDDISKLINKNHVIEDAGIEVV
jgi:hypothetical protein